jgi:hypothetical protein
MQYIVRFESGQYLANCRLGSSYLTYGKTDSTANATRFYNFDSKLVLKRLAEKSEKAQREEAEED